MLTTAAATHAEQVAGLQTQADAARGRASVLRAAARLPELRAAEQAAQQAARAHQAAQLRAEQAGLNRARAEQQLAALAERLREAEAHVAVLEPAAQTARATLAAAETAGQQATRTLDAATQTAADRAAGFNQLTIGLHQLQNQAAAAEQEMTYKRAAAEGATRRAEQQRAELIANETETTLLHTALQADTQALTTARAAREAAQLALAAAEVAYLKARGGVDAADRERRERERERGLAEEATRQLAEKVNETKLALVAVRERLTSEFGLTFDDDVNDADAAAPAAALPVEPGEAALTDLAAFTLDDLNRRRLDLRKRLEALGPVNPLAHEAYAEIGTREAFIRAQRDDLGEAKQLLLKTIGDIDAVAQAKYLAAFGQIKENFGRVFCSLFHEGDTCDLQILDAANPLESRIEILARPKGKRPLTINQLSGGEKTLTAVALLFAIYLLKPAPFCIFDEVDAPLDDANIDKFNHIITEFSGSSQFIIVTHNKRTMAATDVLYGITMTEPGVSRALPVDLRTVAA